MRPILGKRYAIKNTFGGKWVKVGLLGTYEYVGSVNEAGLYRYRETAQGCINRVLVGAEAFEIIELGLVLLHDG